MKTTEKQLKLVALNKSGNVEKGKEWLVGSPFVIGRNPDSQLCYDHQGVSRRHAEIKDGVLIDLGSMNGTFVHDERVSRVTLTNRLVFRLSNLQLMVVVIGEENDAEDDREATMTMTSGTSMAGMSLVGIRLPSDRSIVE
jgi:pSer/pThr/pTyr-binding forkhead associated (FHA) protein